jgi:hypothetical protein
MLLLCLTLQLEEMEAAVAAKLAQLAALQQENAALKHKQEALESTIVIQEKVVAQLSALQLAEQQQQQQQQGIAATAASSSVNAGGTVIISSSSRNAAADVSALLAAVTGEPQQPGMLFGQNKPDLNNPAGNYADDDDDDGDADINNPDWAGIMSSGVPVQRLLSGPQLGPEQLDVHMLLDRWGHNGLL